jgi:hypothetical protein
MVSIKLRQKRAGLYKRMVRFSPSYFSWNAIATVR